MQHANYFSLRAPKTLIAGIFLTLYGLAMFACGCRSLSPGDTRLLTQPEPARVILLRGWQDLYSEGVDQLGAEIASHGIATQVFRANQWQDVADTLLHAADHRPVTLIGFSYGADDVILVARKLGDANRRVDLLITIDPVTPQPVPANVRRCFNYYQSNGVWDALPWLRGVPLTAETQNLQNANLRTDRKDLLQPGTSHATIAGNPLLHQEIVTRVLKSVNRQS